MKKILMITLTSFLFFNSNASVSKFELQKKSGAVKFFAIGNPSAIHIDGLGDGPVGSLELDANDKTSKISGQFDFDLNSLNSGIDMRDSHMKEKYLEVEKYPTAILKIDTINIEGNILKNLNKSNVPFSGTLVLHGKAHAVNGVTELKNLASNEINVQAKFKVKSTDFNIEIPSFAGITVADDIEIEVQMNVPTKK